MSGCASRIAARGARAVPARAARWSQAARQTRVRASAGSPAAGSRATSIQATPDLVNNPDAFKKFQEAQLQLTGALSRLLAVSERYPDLKSNQNFLALQAQLEGTENRIAVARRDYIEAVRLYNTELKTYPGIWWAKLLYANSKPMAEFTVTDDAKRNPQVKF